jgi:ribosome-binding protein aMBF1 (putative translation factor)
LYYDKCYIYSVELWASNFYALAMSKERILTPQESTALKKSFGDLVRKRRKAIGLSQEDLGFECGLHRTYIGSIERGETNLSLENMAVLAITLRCEIIDLMPLLRQIRRGHRNS